MTPTELDHASRTYPPPVLNVRGRDATIAHVSIAHGNDGKNRVRILRVRYIETGTEEEVSAEDVTAKV